MITIYAKADCGCCTVDMEFHDVASAERAFDAVGFGNGMLITDDAGTVHDQIDTFYRFSTSEEEQGDRSLGYLASLLGGK